MNQSKLRVENLLPFHLQELAGRGLIIPGGTNICIPGLSFAYSNGSTIGAAGVMPMWRGVGHIWTLITPALREHRFFFHKESKKLLKAVEASGFFHRLQAVVMGNHETGHAWALRLGFKFEGIMQAYGANKEDFTLYSKVY